MISPARAISALPLLLAAGCGAAGRVVYDGAEFPPAPAPARIVMPWETFPEDNLIPIGTLECAQPLESDPEYPTERWTAAEAAWRGGHAVFLTRAPAIETRTEEYTVIERSWNTWEYHHPTKTFTTTWHQEVGRRTTSRDMVVFAGTVCRRIESPALAALLDDADTERRYLAALTLGAFKDRAQAAVPALTRCLDDSEPVVRCAAAASLLRLKGDARGAGKTFLESLTGGDDTLRARTVKCLRAAGEAARGTVPELAEGLSHPDRKARKGVVQALEGLGPAAEAALPALVRTLKDEDPSVRMSAATAVGFVGFRTPSTAVPALTGALEDRDKWVRYAAALVLQIYNEAALSGV